MKQVSKSSQFCTQLFHCLVQCGQRSTWHLQKQGFKEGKQALNSWAAIYNFTGWSYTVYADFPTTGHYYDLVLARLPVVLILPVL